MNGLPTGVYQPGSSIVHGIDAVIKVLCLLLVIAAVLATDSPLGYLILILVISAIVYVAELPVTTALSSTLRLSWFFAVVLAMNLCFFTREGSWLSFWIFTPSYAGLMHGVNVVARLAFILLVNNVLTVTTSPSELIAALEKLLSPLRFLRVPTEQVAMIITVAISLIPTLSSETEMIRRAQTARGARFDSRKLHEKAAAAAPLVIPVFLAAFRRADELSLAMEARGCRVDMKHRRRRWKKPGVAEYAAIIVCLGLLGLEIVVLQSNM